MRQQGAFLRREQLPYGRLQSPHMLPQAAAAGMKAAAAPAAVMLVVAATLVAVTVVLAVKEVG